MSGFFYAESSTVPNINAIIKYKYKTKAIFNRK